MHDGPMNDAQQRLALKEELDVYNIHIQQPDDAPLFTKTPSSSMQPVHWKRDDLKRLLKKIGADLAIDSGGNRRTLRLANPGLAFGTTPTFWCSIQYILPGEVAGAHRHAANAMRIIMEGTGAKSAVDGEEYPFSEGDLVMTPSWSWHDHTHEGAEPMVWLDILDISLVRSLHATFFEMHPDNIQKVSDVPMRSYYEYGAGLMRSPNPSSYPRENPLLAYPYDLAQAAVERAACLPSDPYDDTVLEYQNPVNGKGVTNTIGVRLLRLRPGFKGAARRHTGSKVYYIFKGAGTSLVNEQTFNWAQGDFISIPPWAEHRHSNDGAEPAIIFEVNDLPTIKALGFYREEGLAQA